MTGKCVPILWQRAPFPSSTPCRRVIRANGRRVPGTRPDQQEVRQPHHPLRAQHRAQLGQPQQVCHAGDCNCQDDGGHAQAAFVQRHRGRRKRHDRQIGRDEPKRDQCHTRSKQQSPGRQQLGRQPKGHDEQQQQQRRAQQPVRPMPDPADGGHPVRARPPPAFGIERATDQEDQRHYLPDQCGPLPARLQFQQVARFRLALGSDDHAHHPVAEDHHDDRRHAKKIEIAVAPGWGRPLHPRRQFAGDILLPGLCAHLLNRTKRAAISSHIVWTVSHWHRERSCTGG